MFQAMPDQSKNALPDRTSPEKASECVVRRRMCRKWAMDYGYPGSIPGPPEEALSILYRDRGCQANRTSFPQPPSCLPRLPLEFHTQLKLQSISPPVPPCRTTNKTRHPPRTIYSPLESIPKQTSIKPRHFIPECYHFGGRH